MKRSALLCFSISPHRRGALETTVLSRLRLAYIYIFDRRRCYDTRGKHHCEGVRSRNFIDLFVGIVACRQAWHGEGSNTTFCFIFVCRTRDVEGGED